jgi:hypothetical protein
VAETKSSSIEKVVRKTGCSDIQEMLLEVVASAEAVGGQVAPVEKRVNKKYG